jgi:DNA-binding IclR family transcriptional regulator
MDGRCGRFVAHYATKVAGGGSRVSPVKSLLKGLQALDLVRASADPVRTVDVAKALGVDKASASRILGTLAAAGYLERTARRRYTPGDRLRPGPSPQLVDVLRLREQAQPLLHELVRLGSECAHLAVLAGDRVLYLDKVEAPQTLRVDQPIGALAPLHCTALGKVYLAFAAVPLPARLERHTARTLTEPRSLAAHLRRATALGYTTDDEEFTVGVRCVAAPLLDEAGRVVGAIGLSGPAPRIPPKRLAELGPGVREVAARFGGDTAARAGRSGAPWAATTER